jgi:hypothetical protein
MKKILSLILAALIIIACKNEKDEIKEGSVSNITGRGANDVERNIYRSGDSMLTAFNRKDWKTFVQFHHPAMIKMMGGVNAYASFVSQQMKQIPDTAVKGVELGKILQVVKTPKDQQCVVEQNMKIFMEGIDLSRTTYLIGESLDNGNTWAFLDATAKSGVTPKAIKPDLSDELKIPATKKYGE